MSESDNALTPAEMGTFLVKFFFKDGQLDLIPDGIPMVPRASIK